MNKGPGTQHPDRNQPVSEIVEFEQLIEMTETMLQAAREGLWEQVIEIESKRGPGLKAFFNTLKHSPAHDITPLQASIEAVIEMDKEIALLGEKAKEGLADSQKQLVGARQAAEAYQKNTIS